MARKRKSPPTQETRPRGKDAEGKPAKSERIPVPTREEFFRDLDRVAKPEKPRKEPVRAPRGETPTNG